MPITPPIILPPGPPAVSPAIPPTPPTTPPLTYTALDIIQDALIEVLMLAPGETPDAETGQWAFRKLNYLLDTWAARKNFVYASTFFEYALVPNLSPHTIGPSGVATYYAPQRPVKVVRAQVILNASLAPLPAPPQPFVSIPLRLRDEQWWMDIVTIQGLVTSQPTDLFYNPAFPDGQLYFWPVPNTAYGIRLECWVLLPQFTSIQDPIGGPNGVSSLAPGYRDALMLTLAESLLPGGGKAPNPQLSAMANVARCAVFGNNNATVRMQTKDSGIPGYANDRRNSHFNYKSRSSF